MPSDRNLGSSGHGFYPPIAVANVVVVSLAVVLFLHNVWLKIVVRHSNLLQHKQTKICDDNYFSSSTTHQAGLHTQLPGSR